MKDLSWERYESLEDWEVSYLLYLEGKDIKLISRIRNMDKGEVEGHIINGKIKYRAFEGNGSAEEIANKLMKYRREERTTVLKAMSPEEREKLEKYALGKLFDSSREECVFYIWLLGELGSKQAVTSILAFLKADDGHIKRMSCSALGKIGDIRAEEGLIKALMDTRPQVREYAVKALGRIGSAKAKIYFKRMLENPNEKDYVKRAAQGALEGKLD